MADVVLSHGLVGCSRSPKSHCRGASDQEVRVEGLGCIRKQVVLPKHRMRFGQIMLIAFANT